MDPDDPSVDLRDNVYWPNRFTGVRDELISVLDVDADVIHHVGSTAIPDVPGKPALDVIVEVEDQAAVHEAATTLVEEAGFERPDGPSVAVRFEDDWVVIVKLHPPDDPRVHNQIVFRDHLCEQPAKRRAYAECKREAARAHPDDLEAYTRAKQPFVAEILSTIEEAEVTDD